MAHSCSHWVRVNPDGSVANYFHTETPMDIEQWLKDWPEGTQVECLESLAPEDTRDLGNRRHAWKRVEGKGMICHQPLPPPKPPEPPKPSLEDRMGSLEALMNKVAAKMGVS